MSIKIDWNGQEEQVIEGLMDAIDGEVVDKTYIIFDVEMTLDVRTCTYEDVQTKETEIVSVALNTKTQSFVFDEVKYIPDHELGNAKELCAKRSQELVSIGYVFELPTNYLEGIDSYFMWERNSIDALNVFYEYFDEMLETEFKNYCDEFEIEQWGKMPFGEAEMNMNTFDFAEFYDWLYESVPIYIDEAAQENYDRLTYYFMEQLMSEIEE